MDGEIRDSTAEDHETNAAMIAPDNRQGFAETPGWVEFRRERAPAD